MATVKCWYEKIPRCYALLDLPAESGGFMRLQPNKMSLSILAGALLSIATSAFALTPEEERQLARSAIEDVTPQQFFTTAIREAGGAYKIARRDCATMYGTERSSCAKEAKATYDEDMTEARADLRNRRE